MYPPVGLLVAGLGFGILTLMTVLRSPQFSLAASVTGGPVILLATAWICLLTAAAQLYWGDGRRRPAVLLALAGLAWLIPEWDNPDAHPSQYAAAILLGALAPALLLHAALAWSDGRVSFPTSRTLVVAGYVVFLGLQGLAPALVLDPSALDCTSCPANPWLVSADAGVFARLETVGGIAAAVWLGCAVIALAAATFPLGSRMRPPALRVPTIAFLLVLIVWQAADLRGLYSRDPLAGRLWLMASLALMASAGGALWQLAAERRARRSLNRILLDLSRGKERGLLRDAFAERLHDSTVQLLYLTTDGVLVNANGGAAAVGPDRAVTRLAFEGAPVAVLSYTPVAAVPRALDDLARAMRLGLEHEALTARALAEERDLRESGMRLLVARDAERRRLERDLHDGAQQRLVGIALGLQLLARRCPGPLVEEARRELTLAIADVRSTAQGLSPPVLVDAGVSAALRSLAETRPLSIGTATIERMDQATETTVYQLVEVATREASGHVDVANVHGRLDVRVVVDINMPDLTDVADRIVTLGGRMVERRDIGTTEICVTLPFPGAGVEATTLPRPS